MAAETRAASSHRLFMQAGARRGEGRSLSQRNRERPSPPPPGSPVPVPSLGEQASLLHRLVACSPHPVALRQRLKSGEGGVGGRPLPRSFLPGTGEGGGGVSGLGAGPAGVAPALPLTFPTLFASGNSGLGDPAAFSASGRRASLPSSGL